MTIDTKLVLLSIAKLDNHEVRISKITNLENEVKLNTVEQQIATYIKDQAALGKAVEPNYLIEKYSYVFDNDVNALLGKYLKPDSIDSAIYEIKFNQSKLQLAEELSKMSGMVETMDVESIKDKLNQLTQTELVNTKTVAPDNGFKKTADAYKDLQSRQGVFSFIIPEVNEHVGMLSKGDIATILGFVGSFKSTYTLNIGIHNALQGFNVLYLALENTEERIFSNAVINYIATNAKDRSDLIDMIALRDGKLAPDQIKLYNQKHNELVDKLEKNLIIWDKAKFRHDTFADMTHTLKMADEEFISKTGKGLELLIIDQVSLLRQTKGSGRKTTYDGAVINDWMVYFNDQALSFLNRDEQIGVIAVSQVGREKHAEASKKRNKGRYGADAASDSNEIERISTSMITLYVDTDNANTLLIMCPKARKGKVTTDPIHVEVYGEYAHVGPLNVTSNNVSIDVFNEPILDINNLL